MTSDLVTFLRARLDEDEQVARAAVRAHESEVARYVDSLPADVEPLAVETSSHWNGGTTEAENGDFWCGLWAAAGIVPLARMDSEYDTDTVDHIARHDPARVLAEVAAKRQIVGNVEVAAPFLGAADPAYAHALGHVLRSLVLPYADHPECHPSWLPPVPDRT